MIFLEIYQIHFDSFLNYVQVVRNFDVPNCDWQNESGGAECIDAQGESQYHYHHLAFSPFFHPHGKLRPSGLLLVTDMCLGPQVWW